MSFASGPCPDIEPKQRERRSSPRYEIDLALDIFHLQGARHLIWAGAGRTTNWSRNSILIRSDQPFTTGGSVQLVIRWSPGMQLMVTGRVLSSEARGTVIKILKSRFRGRPQFHALAATCDSTAPLISRSERARAC